MISFHNYDPLQIMKLKDLRPNPKNPRIITPEKQKMLEDSLREFGDLSGFVFNQTTRQLVGGHQRTKIMPASCEIHIEKKFKTPTKTGTVAEGYVDFEGENHKYREVKWDLPRELAANLAANKHGGDWDFSILPEMMLEIDQANIDHALTGFDPEEWENIMAPIYGEENEKDDEVPAPPKVPKSKLGDIYELGSHRLMCGDSTNIKQVELLMAGKKADMVFTDPPYNHASEDKGIVASVRQTHRRLMDSSWDKNFDIGPALKSIDYAKAENCTVYICTSFHLAGEIWDWSKKANQSSWCVWVKPNPMPSLMKRHWTWDKEMICYSTYGRHVFNFPDEGHAPSSWLLKKSPKNDLHPTMKPVEVPSHAILHSSNKGQVILDLFGGSGSTLIACEKTMRKCFMMEIDPVYCDVIIKRWEDYTGLKAKLLKPEYHYIKIT